MKQRIGTFENPIKLVSESVPRRLLLAHSKNTSIGVFDFHSLPDFGEDVFIRNVLFNGHLTLQEVKLAIYFFEELSDSGKVFSTSLSEFCPALVYGDVIESNGDYFDCLVIGSEDSFEQEIFYSNDGYYPSLSMLTTSMGMKLTSQGLTNLVRQLHNFGYITVTDITAGNTYGSQNPNSTKKERARLRHIRLCNGMRQKDMSNRWLTKRRKKPKKTFNSK